MTSTTGLPASGSAGAGFSLPSAVLLAGFALGLGALGGADAGWLHGLKVVTVAVVAQAVWGVARNLAADRERASLAIVAAVAVLASRTAASQVLIIVVAGVGGWGRPGGGG